MRKTIFTICLVVFICCLIGLGYIGVRSYLESRVHSDVSDLLNTNTPAPTPDTPAPTETPAPEVLEKYKALVEENPDTYGWLKIDNSTIDFVVMYTPEEPEKYLKKDFYGNPSNNGTLFIAGETDVENSDNLIIFGHHMATGAMFGNLMAYARENFWQQHKTIQFDTIYEEGTYEVVASFYSRIMNKTEEGFRYYHFFGSEDEESFNEYKEFIEANKNYDTGVEIEYGDKLITLSTCAYHVENGRFAVVAKRIDDEAEDAPAPGTAVAEPVSFEQMIEEEAVPLAAAPEQSTVKSVSSDLVLLGLGLVVAGIGVLALGRKREA